MLPGMYIITYTLNALMHNSTTERKCRLMAPEATLGACYYYLLVSVTPSFTSTSN